MGSDDFFHKRKTINNPKRRKATRKTYSKILIVCEGKKTEPLYFQGLITHYRLNSANLEVTGDCGSDPKSVFEYAKQRYQAEDKAGDPFDKVYCVFDKDQHPNYPQALNKINNIKAKNTFVAITSVPCFEYWLLLHYDYTTKAHTNLPGNSAAEQMLKALKTVMPNYEKNQENIFSMLFDKLEIAKKHAVQAWQAAKQTGTDNPSTNIHQLVEALQNIPYTNTRSKT